MIFILFLTIFYFSSFFSMEKLHPNTVALIVTQPGTMIIDDSKNSTVAGINCLKEFNNLYKQFIPAITLLLTCKSYYNNDLKLKVKYFLMNRSIPQGLLIHICPTLIRYDVFVENQNYEKIVNLSDALINSCVQETPITDNKIHQVIVNSGLSPDQLNFIVISRTLIEDLYFRIQYTQTPLMKKAIKNIFLIIEYLCKEKKIDLELPIEKSNTTSIEQYIAELYTLRADNLTDVSLPCIKILSKNKHPKSIYERPDEDPAAIGKIADLFLFLKYKDILKKEKLIIKKKWKNQSKETMKN